MTSLWIAAVLPAFPVVTRADPAPRAADLAVAEGFIDAFYSFDATRLEHALAAAPASMPLIGFYQRWALGGNYRIVDRRPCESVDASGEIRCAITVKDDLMGALGIAFEVTDTFHLRVADGVIRSVSTSSNDLAVFRRAEKWVWREREALVREPCTGYFDGGPTPELCVRAMVEGFAAFRKTAEFREQAAAEAVHGIDVAELTVESAGEGLRNRRYTARQLAEAFLVRIAIYNPGYNAIITPNPEALRGAAEIDRRRAAGEPMGALAGIPVVVKDTIDIAGLPTTAGWARLSARAGGIDLVPVRDAPVVERLRGAGAVILGKTNVPVLSLSADNANDSWAGPTFNAAAPRRAPGGSSAGTATAVAASFAILGLAEETGGSIQNPAAFQSLVGIKPTFALVPNSGVVPIGGSTRDVVGPIARTVRDAAIALDVLAGYTAEDPKTAAAIARVPAGGYAATLA
ncbi:MAG: amidase, partial [Gammaproteobacteria bacterium]